MKKSVMLLNVVLVFVVLISSTNAAKFDSEKLSVNTLVMGDYGMVYSYEHSIPVIVTMTNSHNSKTLYDLRIKVEISGLDVLQYSNSFSVKYNSKDSRIMFVNLPKTVPPGEYDVRVTVSNDLIKRTYYHEIFVV
jgi:hypothetical protein